MGTATATGKACSDCRKSCHDRAGSLIVYIRAASFLTNLPESILGT